MPSIQGSGPLPQVPPTSGAGPGPTFNDSEANRMSYFLKEFLHGIARMFIGTPVLNVYANLYPLERYFESAMSKQPISDQTLNDLQGHLNDFIEQVNKGLSSLGISHSITAWNFQSDNFTPGSQFLLHLVEVGRVCREWQGSTTGWGALKEAIEKLDHFANYGPVWSPQTMSQATDEFISAFNRNGPFDSPVPDPNYQNFW